MKAAERNRNTRRLWIMAVLLCIALLVCGGALAETMACTVETEAGVLELRTTRINEEEWLFLPAFADMADVRVNGLVPAFEADEESESYTALIGEETLHMMQSENLRALFLLSSDPENEGRRWLEDGERHSRRTTGSILLFDADGTLDASERLKQLRGRGNFTWNYCHKKSYQIKTVNKTDLLKTGIAEEASRTWVLLSETQDTQLMHNRMSLDMAREMGLNASRCESVDFYYDGEYRGTYLLAEKVEVGKGRVAIKDYDKIMEQLNPDEDELTEAQGENAYGLEIHYYEGAENTGDPADGGYLLEMEMAGVTLSDPCWFRLSNGTVLAIKSPEIANKAMVCYISERMEDMCRALQNGELPEGTLDVDAMARTLLCHYFAYNLDGYTYSSSTFTLDAHSDIIVPGPVWDFDLAYRYMSDLSSAGGFGYRKGGWMTAFLQVPKMQQRMAEIWRDEMKPIVENILLGDQEGSVLQPLRTSLNTLSASAAMNAKLYGIGDVYTILQYGADVQTDLEMTEAFLRNRIEWMDASLGHLYQNEQDTVCLNVTTEYMHTAEGMQFSTLEGFSAEVTAWEAEQLTEADEENYAEWLLTLTLEAGEGHSFTDDLTVYLNGEAVSCTVSDAAHAEVSALFADESYKPVDDCGTDIGLVLDLSWFRAHQPALCAELGDDEAIIEYFDFDGMYEGLQGNAFFSPRQMVWDNPDLEFEFGEEWSMYYEDFIDYGFEEWEYHVAYAPRFAAAEEDMQ